ncbi:hypothetical protein NQ318_022064 [Aromia moschata]|uniref:RNase H type-1 domain-containing protein n=1 Tax=Aromia moschata TaxID=1265417 RepID=A0AAV8Z7Z5_9CUCU|nr:hypothetical protein NQ318_022064 [Aromia moschata]
MLFNSDIRQIAPEAICIYTDGSKISNNTGCAIYDSTHKFSKKFKLPDNFSVYSAEAVAIIQALEYIKYLQVPERYFLIITDRCGDKTITQKQVCEIFNTMYPDRRISQSTVSRIENKFREFGNVTDIPKSGNSKTYCKANVFHIYLVIKLLSASESVKVKHVSTVRKTSPASVGGGGGGGTINRLVSSRWGVKQTRILSQSNSDFLSGDKKARFRKVRSGEIISKKSVKKRGYNPCSTANVNQLGRLYVVSRDVFPYQGGDNDQ